MWHELHRSRIGLVGEPSSWLVASTPAKQVVTDAWGPTLVDVDMQVGGVEGWDAGGQC